MSQDGADLRFDSSEQEIRYWKSKTADLQDVLREAQSELTDFMESSKDLEKEMEIELASHTNTIQNLTRRNEQLSGDLEDWKSKYSRALSQHNSTLTDLQKELSLLRDSVDVYKAKLRDTEMTNDELENAERMIASSLADMEGRYNKTIEKTALLEEELIEKTRLEEENQRLKDELREMAEEMAVLRDTLTRSRAVSTANTVASSTHDRPVSRSDQSFDSSPQKTNTAFTTLGPTADHPPSSRQPLSSPSLNRLPISRRLGAMSHNRRSSRDIRAAEPALAAVQDDSPNLTSNTSRTSTLARRDTLVSTPSHTNAAHHNSGLTSSPSARAQLRASVRAVTRTVGPHVTPRNRLSNGGVAGSKLAEMISKMKALENRINSAKDLSRVVASEESAIPRPSSRMTAAGSAFGSPSVAAGGGGGMNSIHMPTGTPRGPRASMDGNRTIGSSIPIPSRVRRPSSRMSERGTPPLPSLGLPRSQTPSSFHVRSSSRGGPNPFPHEFMDTDPASTLPHVARYAAASASLNSSTCAAAAARRRSSMTPSSVAMANGSSHTTSFGSLAKVRSGSTLPGRSTTPSSMSVPRVTQSSASQYYNTGAGEIGVKRTPLSTRLANSSSSTSSSSSISGSGNVGGGHKNASSVRGSVNGPPSSWKSSGQVLREATLTRSRSGSFGSQDG
ncbi:related to nuclear distribution protein RO11 [Melanopsichium pennsylvanicum]|uniref:Related to nuclear distribution protein RO11 n=1 Tax=Melanopsichium pennsylvanicum TaxID=63383 RepID=A0AAJ4XKP6_9BASI|nr:related to nuclear distribution protein RO11 [Melanopsichium pennsylvanicum]